MALTTVSSDRLSTNVKNTNFTAAEKQDLTDDILPLAGQLGNRNLIINGAMQVAQRGTTYTGANQFTTVDRFSINHTGLNEDLTTAQADISSGTTPYTLGFKKSFKITNGNQSAGAGSGDHIYISQKIEAQNIATSGWNYTSTSSNVSFSFWVKSSVAQNFYGYLLTKDGTTYLYPFETGSLSADTWTKVTKTIPGNSGLQFDMNTNTGLEIVIAPFFGTDKTGSVSLNAWGAYNSSVRMPDNTSTWYTTNDATFEITGVQLEVGSVATDFEHRSFGQELALCQRYYYVIADGSELADQHIGNGFGWSSSQVECAIRFPVVMRGNPSLLLSTGTNYYMWRSNGSQIYVTNVALTNANPRSASIFANSSMSVSGAVANGSYRTQLGNASAYLHLNAEL